MRPAQRVSVWMVLAMLLGMALSGRTVLDSEAPSWLTLGIAVVAALGCRLLRRGGKSQASLVGRLWSLVVFAGIVFAVAWTGGRTQVATWWTAIAFGCLGWVWCRALLENGSALSTLPRLLALFSAAVILCQVAGDELYDFPILLMRSVAFAVLLLAIGLWLVEDREENRASPPAMAGASLLGPTLALIGFVLAILWSLALDPAKSWASRVRFHFQQDAEVMKLEDFGSDQPLTTSYGAAGGDGGRSLPRRADIQLGNALRAMIRVSDREQFRELIHRPIYLRTLTLSVISGEGDLTPLRYGEWRYDLDDGDNDGRVSVGPMENQGRNAVAHTVYIESSQTSALPVLAGVRGFGLGEVYEYADDWYQLALGEGQDMVAYHAVSDYHRAVTADVFSADWEAGDASSEIYRQLPVNALTQKLRETAVQLGGGGGDATGQPLVERLESVREFLHRTCVYSLEYENPDDLPALENFLYGERRGHCELFAVATVMLLRSQGIPSRVGYGFSGGTVQSKRRTVAFRDRDFHAWAEVLVAGRGWMIFDTTPDGAGANATAVPFRGKRSDSPIPALADYELLQGAPEELVARRSWVPDWLRSILDFGAFYLTEICLLMLGAFMALWLTRVGRARRRARRAQSSLGTMGTHAGAGGGLPGYLEGFLQMWAERGMVCRPAQTIREFVDRLKSDGHCDGEFDEMLRYVYAVRYCGQNRDSAAEKKLRRQVMDFAHHLKAGD